MRETLITTAGGLLVGGLPYTFSRAAATVDDAGVAVASGVKRFGTAAAMPALAEFETIGTVSSGYDLMGSGVAADGVTPLLITRDGAAAMRIHSGTLANVLKTWTSVGTTHGGGARDLLQTYVNQEADVAYHPSSAVVCHGKVDVVCRRFHWNATAWQERGIAVLTTQDGGTSWVVRKDKDGSHLPVLNAGGIRGNSWAFTGYTPEDATPLAVWGAPVDYMASGAGLGGQTALFRDTRTAVGGTWTLGPLYLADTSAAGHFHTAMFFRPLDAAYAGKGYLLTSQGDTADARNRVRVCNDPANYQLDASWAAVNEYAGGGNDPDVADRGQINQWAGIQASSYGTASGYVGQDVAAECVCKVTVSAAGTVSYERKYGVGGAKFDPIWMHCPTPERGGPFVTRSTATRAGATEQRYLYSQDGERWTTIARGDDSARVILPLVFGDWIIFTSAAVTDVRALRKPTSTAARRPLRIGPGSPATGNLLKTTTPTFFDGPRANSTVTFPVRSTLALPPPTPATTPTALVDMTGVNGQEFCATIAPAGLAGGIPMGVLTYRYHVRTTDNGRISGRHGLGSQAQIAANLAPQSNHTGWQPIVSTNSNASIGDGLSNHWFGHWIYQHPSPSGGTAAHRQQYGLAWDIAYIVPLGQSAAIPGYPVTAETVGPDEDFKITLALTAAPWTVGLALRVPHDSWENSLSATLPTAPLFTLYGDASNYVELIADLAISRITVNVKAGGVTTTGQITGVYFQREDDMRFVVAYTAGTVSVTASVGGAGTLLTGSVASTLATQPQDVRLEKADGTTACVDFYACSLFRGVAYTTVERAALTAGRGIYMGTGQHPAYPVGTVILA